MTTIHIPRGDTRTNATLHHMRRLVDQGLRNPLTVGLASDIVAGVPGDPWAQAAALRDWLDRVVVFQPDPRGYETLRTVPEMLAAARTRGSMQVDCDDVAILAAALGKAVGMRARFVVLGFGGRWAPYAHVFAQLGTGPDGWAEMDVTRPAAALLPPSRISFLEV